MTYNDTLICDIMLTGKGVERSASFSISFRMVIATAKCEFREPEEGVNCPGCKHWTGKKCEDESVIRELYEESPKFKALDRMMRQNRGIQIQA